MDRLRHLLDDPSILAADSSASGFLALAKTVALSDSAAGMDRECGRPQQSITAAWRGVVLYQGRWTWIPAVGLFGSGLLLYKLSHDQFTLAQLGGLPEVLRGEERQHLATMAFALTCVIRFTWATSAKCWPGV